MSRSVSIATVSSTLCRPAKGRCFSSRRGFLTNRGDPPDTIGLIIEKHRDPTEKDGFMYFCDACHAKLYEEYFFLEDIVRQLPMVQRNFYGSIERRTCRECGQVMELPPDWDESVEIRAKDNPYADHPYADVQGRSW